MASLFQAGCTSLTCFVALPIFILMNIFNLNWNQYYGVGIRNGSVEAILCFVLVYTFLHNCYKYTLQEVLDNINLFLVRITHAESWNMCIIIIVMID